MPKKPGICKSKGCKNPKVKQRNFCYKCASRKWRADNPLKAAYNALRDNAKRRGKEFDLTLKQFEKFCIKTEYLIGKGKKKESYSIDRKDDNKGYTLSNIRILTLSENTLKENNRRKILKYDYQTKSGRFKNLDKPDTKEVPF